MSPEVSIVIVTYNSSALLDDCLASFSADPMAGSCEILVVDNASADLADTERIVARHPGARTIATGRNAGFGAGNNVGIAQARAPYVLIANPDTRLADGGLVRLVEFMRAHPRAGLAGPRLLNADGTLQHSIRNYPTIVREGVESLLLHRIVPGLTERFTHVVESPVQYSAERRADWVSGAVMFARTDALRRTGGFDEGFFLYSEEIDLCRRLAEDGWETWYTPAASFLHIGGEDDTDFTLGMESQRSKLRYYLKHQGRARTLLLAGAVTVRLLVRSIVWLAPAVLHPDGDLRTRLRTAARVLVRYPGLAARYLLSPAPLAITTPLLRTAGQP